MTYATAPQARRYRVAATTTRKLAVLDRLVARHRGDRILVIGQYLDQLKTVADRPRRAAGHRPDRPGRPRATPR